MNILPFTPPVPLKDRAPGTTRVFLAPPPAMSKGIQRVADALRRFAPQGVEVIDREQDADLTIFHVVGVQNFYAEDQPLTLHIEHAKERGQRYAMIQYCLRSTENGGDPAFWGPLWQGAACVWSYYDLPAFIINERQQPVNTGVSFYHAPLGADSDVFRPNPAQRRLFTIGTSGYVAETEGVAECASACKRTHNWMFHLGPDLKLGQHVASQTGLTDRQVADRWRECDYVSGLRRVEGHELVAIEALFCGTRPVVFDQPHYRHWYGDLAEYVPEADPATVTEALVDLFEHHARPVTDVEIEEARRRFSWETVCRGFWERVL